MGIISSNDSYNICANARSIWIWSTNTINTNLSIQIILLEHGIVPGTQSPSTHIIPSGQSLVVEQGTSDGVQNPSIKLALLDNHYLWYTVFQCICCILKRTLRWWSRYRMLSTIPMPAPQLQQIRYFHF